MCRDTYNNFVIAHLEHSTVTGLASTIVATMPSSADTVTNLPSLLTWTYCHNMADDFMAWYNWELAPS